jgi:hypothetical protein
MVTSESGTENSLSAGNFLTCFKNEKNGNAFKSLPFKTNLESIYGGIRT